MLTRSLVLGFAAIAFAIASPVLTYSTYLRDSFTPKAIATDSAGNIYIAGNAIVDPATMQTTLLVVKLNPQGTEYLYVRYFGGSVGDFASAIAVDGAGNAYVAGSTASPDFPVVNGGHLGSAPTGQSDQRSFVAKFDPNGDVVFSDLLGGAAASIAQAVAINAGGQVLVSGTSTSSGFTSTPGAYSIADTTNHPYLLELDSAGMTTIFSATGIGGSAIALDPSGFIYVAGTTQMLDYPTTPGAYQTTFPQFGICSNQICEVPTQAANQYVTKVDPTGSKLIYSTAVGVPGGGNTTNSGLAVDASGAVYLTGFTAANYPFTNPPPAIVIPADFTQLSIAGALPFLSKLDPLGQSLLFSVPVGGAGVQVDSTGAVYVGGEIGPAQALTSVYVTTNLPALASVPSPCLPNDLTIRNSVYVSQVDAASGNVLGSQFVGGSWVTASAVALHGSTLWIAGATNFADVPVTTGALTVANLGSSQIPGAYLGAVDFSQPVPAGTPQVACILDAADLAPAGPGARGQVLAIFGTGLGPATGLSATDDSITVLGGVNVTSGAEAAPLLYVSATQINFAVPNVSSNQTSAAIQVIVNSASTSPVQLALGVNPSIFLNQSQTFVPNAVPQQIFPVALNADDSVNSATNPAQLGSILSIFVNGLAPNLQVTTSPPQFFMPGGWSVADSVMINAFVLRVDLQVPQELVNSFSCPPSSSVCTESFSLYDIIGLATEATVGPQFGLGEGSSGAVIYIDPGH